MIKFPSSARQTPQLLPSLSPTQLPKSIRLSLLWSTFTAESIYFNNTRNFKNNTKEILRKRSYHKCKTVFFNMLKTGTGMKFHSPGSVLCEKCHLIGLCIYQDLYWESAHIHFYIRAMKRQLNSLPDLVLLPMCCWRTCRVKNMWQQCGGLPALSTIPLRDARAASSRKAALSGVGAFSTLWLQSWDQDNKIQ